MKLVPYFFYFSGVLTAAEEFQSLLVCSKSSDHEGVKTIFKAMNRHKLESDIQQKGCILIQVLAPSLCDGYCQMALRAVIEAMCEFPHEKGIQADGCAAMFVIAQIDTAKSEMLVNNCAHERLFFVLEHFAEEAELVCLASQCIWYLGWERDLNQSMLLSACAGGLLKGAVCLIKKGADVNAGDRLNTPLCSACRNGREEMVKFLLTQGITDVQSALELSLEMGHGNIVGLLLQYLSHDKEAGIIALSNLNLGDLQPEWISPSLTGHKYCCPPVIDVDWTEHLDDAKKTMNFRATLSSRLSNERFEANQSDVSNCSDAVVQPDCASDESGTMVKSFSLESIDDTDSDNEFSDNEFDLTDESPLRARSISGASFPFSSRDPRIVSPYLDQNCVILPGSARGRSFEEQPPDCQRPVLKRRAISDITRPFIVMDGIRSVGGFSEDQPRPRTSAGQVNEDVGSDDSVLGVFRMPHRSFMYSWELQGSFREAVVDERFDKGSLSSPRKESLTCKDSELRQKRRQSIRSISANATVRLIDLSGNNMTSLEPMAQAEPDLLAYLAKVEKLDLNRNHLSHFPDELCDAMPRLQCVNLSHNEFTSCPFSLVHETNVKVLNMSHNKITFPHHPKALQGSVMLESLNLSQNEISSIPEWFGNHFPALTSLHLGGNDIKTLPDSPLKLWRLKTLDLSNNNLKEIPCEFLSECFSLDTLVATNNSLTTLPETVAASLTNLKTVRLEKNKLGERSSKKKFSIPRFLLTLPNVKTVDLSGNSLEDIPAPISWATQQLKELVLADNKIRKLSLVGAEKWSLLERLVLSGNSLRQVPSGIGELTSLMSLDLSRNTGITHLPDEMGKLSNLWDLQLCGLKLDLDSAILESRAQELIGFLHSKLKNSVPYYRMKLVVVGKAGRGKTRLLNQLLEDTSDHDIMVRDWYVKDTKAECKTCHRKCVSYMITTWDLKGCDVLYSAYQCLLSSRTLFLVVYDVSKGVSEIDALRPWLLNIHAYAPDASVMLVGSHKDKIPKDQVDDLLEKIKERALSRCAGPGFPQVKLHAVLDCTVETSGVKMLRERIVQLIAKCKCKGHSLVGPRVPQTFLDLQDLISQKVQELELPILRMDEVRKLIQMNELFMDDNEMEQAIKFMNEAGRF